MNFRWPRQAPERATPGDVRTHDGAQVPRDAQAQANGRERRDTMTAHPQYAEAETWLKKAVATPQPPLRARNQHAYRFSGAWSVRLRTQGFHRLHIHPNGWISSACYIELRASMLREDGNEGILGFGAPGILTRPALTAEHHIRPRPGMPVLFPSYLWHVTVPFDGPGTRLTVAFDAVPS